MLKSQKGFALIEGLLILVIVALIGGVGWYVYSSKNKADNSLSSANLATESTLPKLASIKSYDNCVKASGSKVDKNVYPETCTTKAGKKFDNPAQKLDSNEVALYHGAVIYKMSDIWTKRDFDNEGCLRSVTADPKNSTCLAASYLVLKKEGFVNGDQFSVHVSVFKKTDSKNLRDWFYKDVDATEGGNLTISNLTINGRSALLEKSDYSDPKHGDSDLRLSYGIVSKNYGVLVETSVFKNNNYSFTSHNNYYVYLPDIDALVKSIKIND